MDKQETVADLKQLGAIELEKRYQQNIKALEKLGVRECDFFDICDLCDSHSNGDYWVKSMHYVLKIMKIHKHEEEIEKLVIETRRVSDAYVLLISNQ